MAEIKRREVQESKPERLAELVCVLPGQQNGRDVGLDAFNACDRLGKGGFTHQARHQRIVSLN